MGLNVIQKEVDHVIRTSSQELLYHFYQLLALFTDSALNLVILSSGLGYCNTWPLANRLYYYWLKKKQLNYLFGKPSNPNWTQTLYMTNVSSFCPNYKLETEILVLDQSRIFFLKKKQECIYMRVFPKSPATQGWHFCQLFLSFYFLY